MPEAAARTRHRMPAVLAACLLALAGCSRPSVTPPSPGPEITRCSPSGQDRYVYDPDRLQVVAPCLRVTGRVEAVHSGSDGDTILLLDVDPAYRELLTPGNDAGETGGSLDIEAVCTIPPLEPIVYAVCAGDPDPVSGPYPGVGEHVWMEGRYILDLNHEAHAELHPLYRFGPATP